MRFPLLILLVCGALRALAADYFVAPAGSDSAPGTQAAPFATLMRAQSAASAGDTVWLRGGTYVLDDSHITRTDGTYAYVNDFTKAGVRYFAYADETPVFDFGAVKPDGLRVTAFFIRTNNLHLRGFHVVGVQVTIPAGGAVTNTQSENVRISNGSNNTLERLVLRDGMGIGVYIINGSANNLVLNCDAYHNVGLDGISIGNVDGFGSHTGASGTGNVFRGCRAWLNSDDGFDLINCKAPALIEHCWAAFNGYKDAALTVGGDGNGFKAGGYGRNGSAMPSPMPRHVVRFSLAVANRASGFYANHHGGGLDFIHNTAYRNATNFNLLNVLADNLTDVPGYDHYLKNNLGFAPRSTSVANLDPAACDVSHNFFTLPVTISAEDFVATTTNSSQLFQYISAPRRPDGSLPAIELLRLADDSDLIDRGLALAGFAYNLAAPDLGCFENTFIPAPAGFSAKAGDRSVTLVWTPLPGEIRYSVARAARAEGPFAVVASELSSATYVDAGLSEGATYFYVVSAANSFGAGTATPAVSATPLGPVAAWIRAIFPGTEEVAVIGALADPDGDGRPNLLEYFQGSDPSSRSAEPALRIERDTAGIWVLRFSMAKQTPGVSYRIQASPDLVAWLDTNLLAVVEEEGAERRRMRVELNGAEFATERAFWRLQVAQTSG